MASIAVFGAGGHGRVVAEIALALGMEVSAFIDDAGGIGPVDGRPVLSLKRFLESRGGEGVALGIGGNVARAAVYERLRGGGVKLVSLIHPSAVISPTAVVGEGSVVMATAVLNASARCARGVIVNTGAIIEHDCELADFVHVSPNAALGGGVRVGARSHVGIGASVLPLIKIGADVRVGGGACVTRDVADSLTVVGVPARALSRS